MFRTTEHRTMFMFRAPNIASYLMDDVHGLNMNIVITASIPSLVHVQLFYHAMLAGHLATVAEAALGPLPTSEEFLKRIKVGSHGPPPAERQRVDDTLFANLFAAPSSPHGTEQIQKGALKAAEDFQKILDTQKAPISNLDEWMMAFAKWTLHPKFLFDDTKEGEKLHAQRVRVCEEASIPPRMWQPTTLKTVVNALAMIYRATQPEHGIVPSSSKQFPNFCKFFNVAIKRFKAQQATQPTQTKPLQNAEVEVLFTQTNWQSPYENQRMNLLLFGYHLGQRPETLVRLQVGNFRMIEH